MLVLLVVAPPASADPVYHAGTGDPVVLVVGPEADEDLYIWPEGGGLAPFLARRGFSVWIAGGENLAAAVEHVLSSSSEPTVSLVGHGLGGTAIYRYLVDNGAEAPLRSVVTLGAPAGLAPSSPLREAVFEAAADGIPRWSLLAFQLSPFKHDDGDLFDAAMTARPDDEVIWRRAREAGALHAAPPMADLQSWIAGAATLPALGFPVLVTCGELDRMAPCEEAWRARDLLGGTFHKHGYMNLDGSDLGHLDLVLSDRARKRVFPVVVKFLRQGDLP